MHMRLLRVVLPSIGIGYVSLNLTSGESTPPPFLSMVAADAKHISHQNSCALEKNDYNQVLMTPSLNSNASQKWNPNWDFLQSKYEAKRKELTKQSQESESKEVFVVRNLLLIRHGQYILADNDEDKRLTDLGKKQALLTAERISDMLGGSKLSKIHVSTMVRALETADVFHEKFPNVPVFTNDLLCEGKPCLPVPRPASMRSVPDRELAVDSFRIEAAFKSLFHRSLDTVHVPRDKKNDNQERKLPHLEWQHPKEQFEVVVCHGNVIRYFVLRILQVDPQSWLKLSIYNCGITWIRIYSNGKVSIRSVGDVGHIPCDMITYH